MTIPRSNFIEIIKTQLNEGDKDDYDYLHFPMNDDFEKYTMFKD